MPGGRDFYKTLGVSRDATADAVKRAYRILAKKYHPDRNPDDASAESMFKEVQEAYDVLGDADKRAQYDEYGEAGVGHVGVDPAGQRVYQWGGNSAVNVEDLEDLMSAFGGRGGPGASIFDEILGGAGRGRGRRRGVRPPASERGADHEKPIQLTFDQAIHGATVTLRLQSGANGKTQSIDVKIPPGVEPGQKIRLAGKGSPGRHGGKPGDLLLVCQVAPHPFFKRQGADVFVDVPVTPPEAALGAKIEVPTLEGTVTMTLPPGTRSGAKLRLAGRGIQNSGRGSCGDQYAVIQIVVPKSLTDEQRSLYEKLRDVETKHPRAASDWWGAK